MTFIIALLIIAAIVFSIIFWVTDNQVISVIIIGTFITILAFYYSFVWLPRFQCEQKVEMSGYECMWELFKGCQVHVNGQWIPYEKWRVID